MTWPTIRSRAEAHCPEEPAGAYRTDSPPVRTPSDVARHDSIALWSVPTGPELLADVDAAVTKAHA